MSDSQLADLLRLAADAAPAPSGAAPVPDDGDEKEGAGAAPRRRWTRPLLAAAVVAIALVVGSQVLDDPEGRDVGSTDVAGDDSSVGGGTSGGGSTGGAGTAAGASGAYDAAVSLAPPAAAPAPAQPVDAPRIVHTGSIELEVEEGGFAATVDRVSAVTAGLGGYVATAETIESGDAPRGSLTVRVPSAGFEPLLAEVRRLGDVQSVTTSGADVTATYTDLEARLGALRATRDAFLAVLEQAEAIGDILAVQDRINVVNVEIESLEGQRRLLEDQSAFGTLTVTVAEPGADEPATLTDERGDGGLGGAWDEATRGFGNTIEWFVARSGKALVLAVVALALLALAHVGLRRFRRTAI